MSASSISLRSPNPRKRSHPDDDMSEVAQATIEGATALTNDRIDGSIDLQVHCNKGGSIPPAGSESSRLTSPAPSSNGSVIGDTPALSTLSAQPIISTPAKKRKLTFAEKEAKKVEKELKDKRKAEEKARKDEGKRMNEEEKKRKEDEVKEEKRKREEEKEMKKRTKELEKAAKDEDKKRKEEEKAKKEKVRMCGFGNNVRADNSSPNYDLTLSSPNRRHRILRRIPHRKPSVRIRWTVDVAQ